MSPAAMSTSSTRRYRRGGHVLDFVADQITVEVCIGTDLHLSLPMTDAFARADLDHTDAEAEVAGRPSAISEGGVTPADRPASLTARAYATRARPRAR